MKIQIYIPKKDAVAGIINPERYSTYKKSNDYVGVIITTDEFAVLEDKETENKHTLFDEFPEFKNVKAGDFENWIEGLSPIRKAIFDKMLHHTHENKRL